MKTIKRLILAISLICGITAQADTKWDNGSGNGSQIKSDIILGLFNILDNGTGNG